MEDVEKFGELIKDIKFVMFITRYNGSTGLHSRPMTLQDIEFDGDLWFFTSKRSQLAHEIESSPEVCLAFSDNKDFTFVSAEGHAEIVTGDKEKERELWREPYKAWFAEGVDDPDLCLIKVEIHAADYWDSPSSKLVRMAKFAKAMVAPGRDNNALGERGRIDLN